MQKLSARNNQEKEYIARINKVLDYIENNITNDFSLDEIASVACFSKYHFHRIFNSIVGENLFKFIQRLRVERAATLLNNNFDQAITDIGFDCGFSSSSLFTRTFKEYYCVSPSDWRKSREIKSNESQVNSNHEKASNLNSMYIEYRNNSIIWRPKMKESTVIKNVQVEVKDLQEMNIAYIRYIGPYKGDSDLFGTLFGKLCQWAGPRDLIKADSKFIVVYHDNPEITDEKNLRISVSLTVNDSTEVSGEIGKMVIPGGKYALANFKLKEDDFEDAWDWVYGTWLPESGYEADDRLSFEMYNDDGSGSKKEFDVNICIPVKAL